MTWFAFPGGWGVYDLNGVDEKELALTGAHGYATQAQAEAHVNAAPSPDQEILLQAFKVSSTSPVGAGVGGDLQTPASGSSGGIPGLSQIGDFFGALTGANLWIRAAKVIFGGVLLIIGIAHITGAAGTVATAARKVPLPV